MRILFISNYNVYMVRLTYDVYIYSQVPLLSNKDHPFFLSQTRNFNVLM